MRTMIGIARAGLCAALLGFSMAATGQTIHNVTVGDNFFSPAQLTIQAGDMVRWNNAAGGNPHDVTADNGSFASQTTSSFTFTRTFNDAGQVPYHCTVHGAPGGFGMSGTITVEGGGGGGPADLAMSEVSVNSNPVYNPGDPLPIDAEVDNLGASASTSYSVDFYASSDFNITSGDTFLGTSNRAALGAGNSDNFSVNFNLPQNLPPGNYFIGAIIDINDADNGNNSNADDEPISVEATAAADLVLQSVNAPDGAHEQGAAITIQSNTVNSGNLASDAYTITFYASVNNVITASDTALGSQNRSGLAAGANNNDPFDAMIPAKLAPGNYFIGAILDIVDANANNNVNLDNVPIEVTVSGGAGFVINNGLNDSWWNSATGGQGFFITVFPEINAIFLAWFTYDTERPAEGTGTILGEPGHRWLTAFGNYAGNIADLAIELTQGGVFDASEPPTEQDRDYGTIELEFIDCNNAILRYDIPSLGLMGEIEITRIAVDNVPRCQAAQPQ